MATVAASCNGSSATRLPQHVVDLAMALGYGGVLAHAMNAQVIPNISHTADTDSWTSFLMQEWMLRAGTVVLLPIVLVPSDSRAMLLEEHERLGKTKMTLVKDVVGLVLFKAALSGIVLAGYRLAANHAKHLFSAIFESMIGVVYFLSIKFLDEELSMLNVSAVMLALLGVCLTNVFALKASIITQITKDDGKDAASVIKAMSSILAVIAQTGSCSYHVWFKQAYGFLSIRYVLLFVGLMGLCQWVLILPILLIGSHLGFAESIMYVSASRWYDVFLIPVAIVLGNFAPIATLSVIAGTSPLQLSATRLLVLPLVIVSDFFLHFSVPPSGSFVGCIMIIIAFFMISRNNIWPPLESKPTDCQPVQSDAADEELIPDALPKWKTPQPQQIELGLIKGHRLPRREPVRKSI